jgi:hypothetical protein
VLPVATMLEKLAIQALVKNTMTCVRAMRSYQFVLGIDLRKYVGFQRSNQLLFIVIGY